MVWSRSRCSARSLTRHSRPGRRQAPERPPSSGAFALFRPRRSPTSSSLYLYFRVDVRPELERGGQWSALGLFDLKEHFISIGLGLLPAYWVCWRQPLADEPGRIRAVLTAVLAFIVWWSFLIGHVLNNIVGFRS